MERNPNRHIAIFVHLSVHRFSVSQIAIGPFKAIGGDLRGRQPIL
jgi:hypothetical protein